MTYDMHVVGSNGSYICSEKMHFQQEIDFALDKVRSIIVNVTRIDQFDFIYRKVSLTKTQEHKYTLRKILHPPYTFTISIPSMINFLTCILITKDGSTKNIGVIFYKFSDSITNLKELIRDKFNLPELIVLKKGVPLTHRQESIYKVSQVQDEGKISLSKSPSLVSNFSVEKDASVLVDKENLKDIIDLTDVSEAHEKELKDSSNEENERKLKAYTKIEIAASVGLERDRMIFVNNFISKHSDVLERKLNISCLTTVNGIIDTSWLQTKTKLLLRKVTDESQSKVVGKWVNEMKFSTFHIERCYEKIQECFHDKDQSKMLKYEEEIAELFKKLKLSQANFCKSFDTCRTKKEEVETVVACEHLEKTEVEEIVKELKTDFGLYDGPASFPRCKYFLSF